MNAAGGDLPLGSLGVRCCRERCRTCPRSWSAVDPDESGIGAHVPSDRCQLRSTSHGCCERDIERLIGQGAFTTPVGPGCAGDQAQLAKGDAQGADVHRQDSA